MSCPLTRVLLIEPEPTLAEVTALRLELLGLRVTQVSSGREALSTVTGVAPDLIVASVPLPDVSLGDLVRQLSGDDAASGVPVIGLAENGAPDEAEIDQDAVGADLTILSRAPTALEEEVRRQLADPRFHDKTTCEATAIDQDEDTAAWLERLFSS